MIASPSVGAPRLGSARARAASLRAGHALLTSLLLATLATALAAQEPRIVRGVVVDALSGTPVADVLLRIEATQLQTITDGQGRFSIAGVPVGSPRLVLRHLAYGQHSRTLTVGDTGPLDFRIRISPQAIELAPLEVEILSAAFGEYRASGNSLDIIERETIDLFSLTGQSLTNVLAREVSGIRVNGSCVEYRLQTRSSGIGLSDISAAEAANLGVTAPAAYEFNNSCREITVYLDGVRVQEGSVVLQTLSLNDLERIEVLSPSEAGVRYPQADRGVLLLETRRGTVPNAPTAPTVAVTGFGWNESQPYRWARVLGASVAANVAAVGVTYAGLLNCRGSQYSSRGSTQCGEMAALTAGLMTGTVSSLVSTWAGTTPGSRGRTIPSLAVGAATATSGYMLFLQGENTESDASRIAGAAILAVGTPLMLTLTDRVFRRLR